MVRLFHWNAEDVYKFFNVRHPDWPNLPPPPNPAGLQAFLMGCVDATIEQMNRENNPEEAKKAQRKTTMDQQSRPPVRQRPRQG